MHKPLSFVTSDKSLQTLIKNVASSPDEQGPYKIVNQYIFDQALFNVYTHVRRFYFSKNKNYFNKKQIGLSAPAPWQVFE